MRCVAYKVRCVENQSTSAKGWIFYLDDGRRAYLSSNKLNAMNDDFAIQSLMAMRARENRPFGSPVQIDCVQGREQLLVARFLDSVGIAGRKSQDRLI